MARTATKEDHVKTLNGAPHPYPGAVGIIEAIALSPGHYDDPIAEILRVIAALDEVTANRETA